MNAVCVGECVWVDGWMVCVCVGEWVSAFVDVSSQLCSPSFPT